MKCIKCNSTNLEIIKSGPHNKLVCRDCLAFQKFISIEDKNTFNKIEKENIKVVKQISKNKKYDNFIENLVKNTKKLNEDLP